ncbi:MAG: hypothetical protein JXM74_00370 [Fusobacteriaceae bacterium]|nr:hypothetical protein [Fusobacteriaceae bacterium]
MAIIKKNPFESKELSWIDNSKAQEISNENELIIIENKDFDYSELDNKTISFLKKQELNMHLTMTKAYTELGKILTYTQDFLVQNGHGCFLEWVESLGIKKTKAYALIDRYKLLIQFEDSDKKNIVENLPISLAYEISKKNTDEGLKNKVLNGEIKSLKEYKNFSKNKKRLPSPRDNSGNILFALAELIGANRSTNEKTDYELASIIMDRFRVSEK